MDIYRTLLFEAKCYANAGWQQDISRASLRKAARVYETNFADCGIFSEKQAGRAARESRNVSLSRTERGFLKNLWIIQSSFFR